MTGQVQSWWSARMVVEIPAKKSEREEQVGFPKFEDRIILVRAATEEEAHNKAQEFALDYEQTSSWKVRKVVEVTEIVDAKVEDGVEVYSAFISQEWADVLMKGSTSPLAEWKKQNPGKDPDDATVQDIADAWDSRDS